MGSIWRVVLDVRCGLSVWERGQVEGRIVLLFAAGPVTFHLGRWWKTYPRCTRSEERMSHREYLG
jgi:hypothetical protein